MSFIDHHSVSDSLSTPTDKTPLLLASERGLECRAGGFVIDPYKKTRISVLTHAHADHARAVADIYYASESSVPLLKRRLGENLDIRGIPFGQPLQLGNTQVSFHPAGHVLGSAQVRVEHNNDIWVFTGDFKRDADPSCEAFELVRCNTFITEATFALPIYRWQSGSEVAEEIYQWWKSMQAAGRPAILFCYALGKAQRVMAELANYTDATVWLHGAVAPLTQIYRDAGVHMLPGEQIDLRKKDIDFSGKLIIAPPGAAGSAWMKRFPNAATGFCSGWMRIRGNRRRRGYDRGFVLSDHADWDSLVKTIEETGASQVLTTHGQASALIRLLNERNIEARELLTQYQGEDEDTESIEANNTNDREAPAKGSRQ